MKRKGILITLSILLVVGLLVGGCAKVPATPSATTPTATKPTTSAPTTTKPTTSAPTPSQAEVIHWDHQTIVTPAHIVYALDLEIADRVREATNGRLDITVHSVGEISSVEEMVRSVGTGALDIAFTCSTYHMGIIPEANVEGGLPFSYFGDLSYNECWMKYGLLKLMREAYAPHNVYYLTWGNPGPSTMMTKKPVEHPEDMKGIKFRCTGLSAGLVESFGAASTFIATGELYQALALGTIDGAITAITTLEAMKLGEVAPYLKMPAVYDPCGQCIIVNLDSYNALPQDLKYALEWVWGAEARERYAFSTEGHVQDSINALEAQGAIYSEWSEEDLAKLAEKAREVWRKDAAKDPRIEKAYKIVDEYLVARGKLTPLPAGEPYAIK